MSDKLPILYVVIPCYNEEEILPVTCNMFADKLRNLIGEKIDGDSRIMFVDDGSTDSTWNIIEDLCGRDLIFAGVKLSNNVGHQHALLAGLFTAKDRADITISIDCDGQDDIDAMDRMIEKYAAGCDIVYGVRSKRDTDTFMKKFTAEMFYKVLKSMGAKIVFNHADYRLMSRRALEALAKFREVNLFLRGLVPMLGFKNDVVYFERHERLAGESHYPLGKMLSLAFDGISSLSVTPIHFVTMLGFFVSILSVLGIIWIIVLLILGKTVPGWASMTGMICFLGGVQIFSLGVVGEYIGKIYLETKDRPRFIIEKTVH